MADPLSKPERERRRRWYQEPRARFNRPYYDLPRGERSICQELEWQARLLSMMEVYEEDDPRREWIRRQMEAWRERHEEQGGR